MKSFNGKVAAITGAASGMGRALAIALAREGCHLALADKNPEGLAQTVDQARAAARVPLRITFQELDVGDHAAMVAWAAASVAAHGQVQLIFNNAGVALSSTAEGSSLADLEWIMDVNFWGVVYGTQAFLPYLKQAGEGHIINTSSVFGLFSLPGMSAYSATKFAVRGFTESLRQELDMQGYGISATCVHPGGIRTDICRSSRISDSVKGFLIDDEEQGRNDFEKLFITSAETAANAILQGVRKNKRRVLIGRDAYFLDLLIRLLPATYQALAVLLSRRMAPKPSRPLSAGYQPGLPIRRDVQVELPAKRICDWHEQGHYVSHFFNALSLLFPAGELFFMDSVRHYREQIDDPRLKKQVQGFIGQEAMHSREHLRYNDLLQQAGLPAHRLDRRLRWILDFQKKYFPASFNLAITVALEHYTAILADLMLRDPTRLGDSLESYRQIWTWHALEETEHKSVSFDVWNAVVKPGFKRYLIRTSSMLSTTLMFWLMVFSFHVHLLIADRHRGGHLRGMWRLVKFLYGPRGVFPRIAVPWLRFFKPGFHPWDHDNHELLVRIDSLVNLIELNRSRVHGGLDS